MRLGARLNDNAFYDESVRIAALQFEPLIGDRAHNLATIERLVRKASTDGAKLVILPELADSGYIFKDANELASLAGEIPTGESARRLCMLAVELGVYIICGLAERDASLCYNAAIFCGPDGYIGKYRKLHLWNEENCFFTKGNLGLPVFSTPFGCVGLAICYDGWFPETFRQLALAGAELVCIPTNWVPMPGGDGRAEVMANILHMAAAHANSIYIACADRIGIERGQHFIGRSLIVGPQGWPVAGPASADTEEILIADLDLKNIKTGRFINRFNHVLADRRVDVYP